MKRLKNVDINEEEFELVSSLESPRQLYRLGGDQYALALLDRGNRLFKFQSKVVTAVLNDLGGGVEDVTLIEYAEPERVRDALQPGFEIRLHLSGEKEIVSINHNDEVRVMVATSYREYIENRKVTSVRDIWNLPHVYPFDFLEISGGLRNQLEPHFNGIGVEAVLLRMWEDFLRVKKRSSGCTDERNAIYVSGEFCDFVVFEHRCGKVTLCHP
ncbi:hypothetical protein DDZ13_02380 [Coraliomargarita sinensis]|uniref:Uncharacterized protein n=1 Tax=Coraliomargarita sinensis TaxID=2174842 RepID=A0A317ZNH8_9BACT|nr:hypothetical protein [Coraliomargarita sinensis]PXA05737.1 hypothetical protein DDZ13_02380 [Coraliomargarita sinensis]